MKILHLTPAYKPAYVYGGPTMSVARLCEALSAIESQGIEIEVFCTKANGQHELPVPSGQNQMVDGVKVTYFSRLTKDHTHFSPALLWALWKKIKKEKKLYPRGEFQVHIHSWWNLVVLFGALITKIQGVPMVLSPRGMITNYTQNNKNSLVKQLIHFFLGKNLLQSAHIIVSSQKELDDYLQVCIPKSAVIIPNLVEVPSNLPNKISLTTPLFKLLFLSRIEEKKGLDMLIEALAKVDFPWSLSIAGSGTDTYIQELKSQIQHLGLNAKIHWIGHQDNIQKFEVLAAHDMLCLTSHNENFANVIIESLAIGTPVLLSEEVGLARFVKENQLGFICKLDHESIIQSLTQAYQNNNYRETITRNSPLLIKKEFDESFLTEKYLTAYKKITIYE